MDKIDSSTNYDTPSTRTFVTLDGRNVGLETGMNGQRLQVQTLILAHSVRPEWAAMIAALAFGGDAHG